MELLNDKGIRIDQLSQAVDEAPEVPPGARCALDLNSALRAPDDAWTALSAAADRPAAGGRPEAPGIQPDPADPAGRGFNLTYLMTSLLLVLLMSAAMLRVLMPRLRRSYRSRILGSLLLGNLTFVLLHGFVVFKLGSFCSGPAFGLNTTISPGAAWCWAGASAPWRASTSIWGWSFYRPLRASGLLANFMKIAICRCRSGTISATCWPCCGSISTRAAGAGVLGLLFLCWRFALPLDLPRAPPPPPPLLRPLRVRHPNRQQTAQGQHPLHRRAVNTTGTSSASAPASYLFNLVDEMLQSGNVFRYPCRSAGAPRELSQPVPGPGAPASIW